MKYFVALVILAVAVSVDAGASMHNPTYCFASDPIRSMTNMGGVITSYEAIRRFGFATVNPYVSTCTPSRFWLLGRYGTRLPLDELIQTMIDFTESSVQDDIVRNYEAGRTSLCREDFENIRNYTLESDFDNTFRVENAGMITDAGRVGLQNIARRFQQAFPNILSENYTTDRYHFRHTRSVRTNTSIRAFATGLFGEAGAANVVYEDVPEFDWFLRAFDFCPEYTENTANWTAERIAFRQGPEMLELVQQVNSKLGFQAPNQLNIDQVFSMWNLCRFKIAATFELSNSEIGGDSPWCAALSVTHHLILEHYGDLGYFYISGYGVRNQRLLQNLNCGLMQDLLHHMQSENDDDTVARIFMSYEEELQAMLVLLGTFRDVWPMHRHNFAQQTGRNWLTSLISAFGSNLAVVRYDCADGDHDLVFLLNERPILVPGCDQQTGVCKLSVIVNRFERFINANCPTFFCSND